MQRVHDKAKGVGVPVAALPLKLTVIDAAMLGKFLADLGVVVSLIGHHPAFALDAGGEPVYVMQCQSTGRT